jgi:hypothetical protein
MTTIIYRYRVGRRVERTATALSRTEVLCTSPCALVGVWHPAGMPVGPGRNRVVEKITRPPGGRGSSGRLPGGGACSWRNRFSIIAAEVRRRCCRARLRRPSWPRSFLPLGVWRVEGWGGMGASLGTTVGARWDGACVGRWRWRESRVLCEAEVGGGPGRLTRGVRSGWLGPGPVWRGWGAMGVAWGCGLPRPRGVGVLPRSREHTGVSAGGGGSRPRAREGVWGRSRGRRAGRVLCEDVGVPWAGW